MEFHNHRPSLPTCFTRYIYEPGITFRVSLMSKPSGLGLNGPEGESS